jgi:acyl-CoA synthetase (AMP-forming)/AMP-acid ligase II
MRLPAAASSSALAAEVTGVRLGDLIAAAPRDALAAAGPGERLTYGELAAEIDAYAKGLLALGVRHGDRVAMLTPPSVDFWRLMHATASIGAIWVGINPVYQQRDFGLLLDDAAPSVVIAVSPCFGRDYATELAPLLPADARLVVFGTAQPGGLERRDLLAAGAAVDKVLLDDARAQVDPEDPAVIVYTSGTTGRPKGALLSHRAMTFCARTNLAWMGRTALARAICAAPVNHVGAINNICMNLLAAGGTILFYPEVDLPALAALSEAEKPTYLVASPTAFAMMLAAPDVMASRLVSTELLVFGGAATSLATLRQIVVGASTALAGVYGQTETCGIVTHCLPQDPLPVQAETIGRAMAGMQVRIADATGRALPVGEVGEIQARGPGLMSGYFRNPQATAAAFTPDGFLRTGDLGLMRPDDTFIFTGRLKEMFKSGGYNVYPVEIEQAICEHPSAAPCIPGSGPCLRRGAARRGADRRGSAGFSARAHRQL